MEYRAVVMVFGGLLILTGTKTMFAPEKPLDPGKNPLIRLVKRFLPIADDADRCRFFVRRDGRLHATPLFLALVFVEVSDVIFAVDSVPAIFALTDEPLIVYTSNVFAILGLRSLYFLLAGVYDRFRLLKYGLGAVLVFVGLKMVWLNDAYGGKFPVTWSLGFVAVVIFGSAVLSVLAPPAGRRGPGGEG